MASVSLDNVHKVYDDGQVAVEEASFHVDSGELLVLVGPSGCGKTTLLRMIAGLEAMTSGTLSIGDTIVNEVEPKDRDIAMVFQNYALYPHMSVAENLAFGLKLRGHGREVIARRVAQAAETLGISALLARRPAQLSGGQRQRVALGRALVREPAVFLLDEPLSNLDARLRTRMRVEIARLHRRLRATMIYVTHDQVEAMTLGQRIVVLNEGRIQQVDTPMALYERPANLFVASFLGSPAMNVFTGVLSCRDDHHAELVMPSRTLDLGRVPAAFSHWHGRELALGLRPEELLPGGAPPGLGGFEAWLDVVEPVGNEAFLNLSQDHAPVVSRIAARPLPTAHQALHLHFDAARLHVFDAGSGLRLN
ncbi:sn-glycerol-3-phosphate ABC transporter ATP-binding protein UgpC [Oleiagrimonas sp. C23AA]|uniref:ABC transporter ATP-binding protein n=1 Tax=Oleiagrimonas sp. C23AA TaxID=2719047 RepID=UPI00142333A0|nr:sn-glycerol-3-phosphate ABC transporter ATP-binding protein UgpC [Oleiagrimonas sp. C23AA]NII11354.1 sn-glycerol-3-phosphate ABC transporter ATP-binding protein UgpC [Oleiagrimonas sp. C23AA]